MRCPHCAGQIPDKSRFCGICGRQIPAGVVDRRDVDKRGVSSGTLGRAPGSFGSMSLFELPVSRGARIARVVSILALDAVLVGTGLAMILSYVNARDQRRAAPQVVDAGASTARVEVLPPTPVRPPATRKPVTSRDERRAPRSPRSVAQPSSKKTPAGGHAHPKAGRRASAPPGPPPGPRDTPPGPRDTPPGPRDAPPGPRDAPPGPRDTPPGPRDTPPGPALPPDAGSPEPPSDGPSEEEITLLANRIGLVVDRKRGQLRRCYSQAAKVTSPSEPLEGKVVIRFEIMPSGRARNVRTMSNTTKSNQLASCLQGLIRGWSFPASSQPVEFAWPFVFKAPT